MAPTDLTTEEKLAAIIEAHMRGGYNYWEAYRNNIVVNHSAKSMTGTILNVLLDPEGLKAAYGERPTLNDVSIAGKVTNKECDVCAFLILDSWLSGGAEAAINTAYSLLPSNP